MPAEISEMPAVVSTNYGNGNGNNAEKDDFTERIFREAHETVENEPELCSLLKHTVLAPWVQTFEDAVAATVCYRMLLKEPTPTMDGVFCPHALKGIFQKAFRDDQNLEMGQYSIKEAVRKDAQAVIDRDPACETLLEVVLFYKGFSALVVHRVAHQKWVAASKVKRSMTALFLQSQASAIFGLDIHPGACIGAGILLDHGTGIVIGETCHLGDGCTLLHGVTLGGNGKETGDRHPKVGRNVLIGAGASVLGNIQIGDRVKIGAGSIVLRPLPAGATAVGAPAKIIGKTLESNPADTMDESLKNVGHFHQSPSTITLSTVATSTTKSMTSSSNSNSSIAETVDETVAESSSESDDNDDSCVCPYRDYAKFAMKIAKKLPAGTYGITFCQFAKLLESSKCIKHEIVAAFFALDQRSVGYLKKTDMTPDLVTKALMESTALDSQQIAKFLQTVH
ncbi:unnamed protein product [Cylindrotheca closterium]|uniref:serine O-acetyltransferase n=1 Tax=Cylindrotheca closterium TaxID=2856 RepID=A0AAD2GCM1_9STRA|nr:unnamed protein product [Cylindrotheca closterium]